MITWATVSLFQDQSVNPRYHSPIGHGLVEMNFESGLSGDRANRACAAGQRYKRREVIKHCNDRTKGLVDEQNDVDMLSHAIFPLLGVINEDRSSMIHFYSASGVPFR